MTDTHDAFQVWLDEPHPLGTTSTRRDYMPQHDGGFSAMVWQAATLAAQDKRQPLTDEQIIDLAEQWPAETNDWASHFDFARAIESAHGIKAE